jgi:vitamin B12 transporter
MGETSLNLTDTAAGIRPAVANQPAHRPLAALIAALCAAPALATAADEPAADRTVVVTATRESQAVDEVLAPVIVIDRDAIERSLATDVGELLRFHAGLDVARTGGPGQPTSLFIRGTNSNHAIVMIDGVRINPGTLGGAALQNIPPELVERVEVVKGPRSTLYGTDAIGGVVNVITRRGEGDSAQVLAGAGRYGTREYQAAAHLAGSAGELSLGASYLGSDGFPTFVGPTVKADAQQPGQNLDRAYLNRSISVAARTDAGPVELGARYWRASGTSQYSDFFQTPVDENFVNSAAAVEASGQITADWRTRLTLSRAVDDLRQDQEPYPGAGEFDYALTRRNSIDWQNGVRAGAHELTFGALLARENTRSLSYGLGYDVDTRQDTYYAQDQISAGAHRLLLAAGWTKHQTFGGHGTWNAEYGFRVGHDTLLTASAGTAFHAPTSTDRFGYGGNPALAPERSRNIEVGMRHRVGTRHVLALSAFENRIDDLIQFVTLSFDPFTGENRNVDRARIRGVEASWEYSGEAWHARAEAIRQDPVDLADGSRLLRRARETVTLALGRRIGAHEFGVDLLQAGDRMDVGFPPVRLGGYVLANLSARFAVSEHLALQARVENVLDREYQLAAGYRTMRRALMVAARYDYR